MTDTIAFSDAVVALRSFARRYREVLSGPPGDDAWERLVRRPDSSGHSALALAAHAAALLDALIATLHTLPATAAPAFVHPVVAPVGDDVAIDATLTHVARSSSAAADALWSRRTDDAERPVTIDGVDRDVATLVSDVVSAVAEHLRSAQKAIDDAR